MEKKYKHVNIQSSYSDPERESKQEQLDRALRDLKRKVEGDVEVMAATSPLPGV